MKKKKKASKLDRARARERKKNQEKCFTLDNGLTLFNTFLSDINSENKKKILHRKKYM